MRDFSHLLFMMILNILLINSAHAAVEKNEEISDLVSENTIHWYNFNISPGGIPSGPLHGQGIGYLFYQEYVEALPEYQHKFSYANVTRIRTVIERPANNCITYIFDLPEYRPYRHLGPTNYLAPPNRIITRKSVADKWVDQELSLSNLLDNQSLRLGVMAGRAYRVPKILAANQDNPNLIQKHTSSASIYKMIRSDRLDYTLGDWLELAFMEESLDMKGSFVTFPIKEVSDYTPNFVSCTRNAWGKRIVDKLNAHFDNARITEEKILPHIMRWVRDSEQDEYRQAYRRYLQQYFDAKAIE